MRHFSVNDGLPSATIYRSIQDKDGFLWFCTDVGVSRFDGKSFTNFTMSDGLSDNEIMNIAEDSKGRIWFLGFSGGLSYYYKHKIYNSGNDPLLKKVPADGLFMYFHEDKLHRLWFTSANGCVVINGDKVSYLAGQIHSDATLMNSCASEGICVLMGHEPGSRIFIEHAGKFLSYKPRYCKRPTCGSCLIPEGGAYFIAREGVVRMQDTVQKLILPFGKEFESTSQLALLLTKDNKIWISTVGNGVYSYDGQDLSRPPANYLKNKITSSLLEDHEHNIWVGTLGDGIYMFPAWYNRVHNYSVTDGLKSNQVNCLAKDNDGAICAGLSDGNINLISGSDVRLFNFQGSEHKNNRIIQISFDDTGCWIGSDEGLRYVNKRTHSHMTALFRINNTDIPYRENPVKDFSIHNGTIAVATSHSVYALNGFHPDDKNILFEGIGAPRGRAYAVHVDPAGTIWYSCASGLHSYRNNKDVYHGPENLLLQKRINDIVSMKDSVLVLACYEYGLLFYKDGKVLLHITEKDGLTSDICRKLFVYQDDLFISTPKGATRVKYAAGKILSVKKYTNAEGLASNDVNDIYTDDQHIYVATSEGVSILPEKDEEISFKTPPPLYITGISCNGKILSPDSNYKLTYRQNSLDFNYRALAYQLPAEVRYQYRIKNKQPWSETRISSLDFPFLPPGSYQFQLRARVKNSPWSPVHTFKFVILPPFWQTTWFAIAAIFISLGLIVVIFRWRLHTVRAQKYAKIQLKNQIMNLEQQALQSMMNPHFIFNVMNSIQHFINVHDSHAANLFLSDFARLIRMNMDIASKSFIPLDEEITYLQLYLSLESLRFGSMLTYEIEVDETIDGDETMIPVMMLQPFLENAIWHGIMPRKHPGHIQLHIRRRDEATLLIQIIDNGVGIFSTRGSNKSSGDGHESKGMKLTQQRLNLMSTMTGHALYLNIEDRSQRGNESGTIVELTLPADLPG